MQIQIPDLSKQLGTVGKVAAVILAVSAIAGGYAFYRNNIWHPKVTVVNVDWDNQTADLLISKKSKKLFGNSIIYAGGNWGIRFGTTKNIANRIELVQDGLVRDVLKTNPDNVQ